jgi:muramoyltetrapeptide carboxypeptidase
LEEAQMRIAVVAPSARFSEEAAEIVAAIAARTQPGVELYFHPQCFLTHNHFAGPDAARADALVEVANDPGFDAIWFARGGYGACRIAEDALARLGPAAREKAWLGYSDGGFLLAGLYRAGFERIAHGLAWLAAGSADALEPGLEPGRRHAAFNLTVLGTLLGTALEPDLSGHILLLEEVSEHMYAIDRALFHLAASPAIQRVAGIRFGRVVDLKPNDPDFGEDEEAIARHWCERYGIAWLGRADIGHDSANRVVPFGHFGAP